MKKSINDINRRGGRSTVRCFELLPEVAEGKNKRYDDELAIYTISEM